MTDSEHIRCPRCAYDLFGCEQGRCPECGYGYQYEAINAQRQMYVTHHVRLYWHTLRLALISLGCLAATWLPRSLRETTALFGIALLSLAVRLGMPPHTPDILIDHWWVLVGAIVLCILVQLPLLMQLFALLVLVLAVITILRTRLDWDFNEQALFLDDRARIARARLAAWVSLALAAIGVLSRFAA